MRASQGKSFKISASSEKAQSLPPLLPSTPLSLADAKTSTQDDKDSSKAAVSSPHSDPVLWAMEHMNLESTSSSKTSAKADTKSDSKGDELASGGKAFPLPTGRPGRPPVSINNGATLPVRSVSSATGPSTLQGMFS